MGDDEQPAVGPTPDESQWTGPRHRSETGRGRARSRKRRPPPEDEGVETGAVLDAEAPREGDPAPAATDEVELTEPPSEPAIGTATVPAVASATVPAVASAAVPAVAAATMPTPRLPADAATEAAEEHTWLDQDAGPVVRPYTLTGGRSRPFTSGLNLLTHVEALYAPDADLVGLQPEQRTILSLTRTAMTVAELAARLDLPVGVVRVLVGDLIQANLVSTFEADAAIRAPDDDILQAVIDGLRAL